MTAPATRTMHAVVHHERILHVDHTEHGARLKMGEYGDESQGYAVVPVTVSPTPTPPRDDAGVDGQALDDLEDWLEVAERMAKYETESVQWRRRLRALRAARQRIAAVEGALAQAQDNAAGYAAGVAERLARAERNRENAERAWAEAMEQIVAQQQQIGALQASGTYACPRCGRDTPHRHPTPTTAPTDAR